MVIEISIIIPALNEEQFIGNCLQSLSKVYCHNISYEVILVDNGSSDNTCEIALSFLDQLDLKIFVQKDVNIAALRNFGASYAKGSIFAFLDADCTVSKKWLNAARTYFNDPAIAAVGSSHLTPENISWVATTWENVIAKKRRKGYVQKLPSGNLWVSREKFYEINGFNEKLKTNEDFDLCYRLTKKGYKIFSDPAIKAWHWGAPRTLGEFYKKNKWHGIHVVKVFLKSFPSLRNIKPILFGFYYLGAILLFPVLLICFNLIFALFLNAVTLLLPPVWLSWMVLRRKNKSFKIFLKLFVLYFAYGLARAHSIVYSMANVLRLK